MNSHDGALNVDEVVLAQTLTFPSVASIVPHGALAGKANRENGLRPADEEPTPYSVNRDCTREALATTPNSFVPLHLFFVVVRRGTEVHTVLDSSAMATVFIKVD